MPKSFFGREENAVSYVVNIAIPCSTFFSYACRAIRRLLDSNKLKEVLSNPNNDSKVVILVKTSVSVGVGVGVVFNVDVILAIIIKIPPFSLPWLPPIIPSIIIKQTTIRINALQPFIVSPIRSTTPYDQTMKVNKIGHEAYS